MEKKITNLLFSTRLMAVLFITYAVAMAIGTFIESYYNTDTARILVYNAWWFEAIHAFFLINFFGNIKRYQLYKKEKWATLLLHLSFIFILIGAFITRYISYEGVMPIREGASEKVFFSDKTFLTILIDGNYKGEIKRKTIEEPLLLSQAVDNHFVIKDKFDKTPISITFKEFIMNAKEAIKPDDNGVLYLKLVESSQGTRHEHFLKEGEVQNIHNVLYAFNNFTQGAINIIKKGDDYFINTPFVGNYMRMADQFQGQLNANEEQPLLFRSLYNLSGVQFVFPELAVKGIKTYTSNNDWKDQETDDALTVIVSSENKSKEITLVGAKGKMGEPQSFKLGNLEYTLFFGSKTYELPFSIKLNDFIAERYPGTENSYSAFESKVTVEDPEKNFDARIFMNNILDHKGYRFFQASFQPDEKGTVLSVNHDFWGTWISYIGYFLLYLAMMAILFDKNTRFADLKKKLEKINSKKASLALMLFFVGIINLTAQNHSHDRVPTQEECEKFVSDKMPKIEHAEKFGAIVIQDAGGRMKPINTFSSELLRKVSKSDTYKDFTSDQVFLSMVMYQKAWFHIPILYLKRGNDSLRNIIGIAKDAKYASFANFFDKKGNYKLAPFLDDAYKARVPNQFQKDFIQIDRNVVLLNQALSGSILRVFPVPNDINNKWISYLEMSDVTQEDLVKIKNLLPLYMQTLDKSVQTTNYEQPDELLSGLEDFQKKFGSKVRPTDNKIKSEIWYNKYDVFKKLFSYYMIAGVLMLIISIVQIFNNTKAIKYTINFFHILIGLFFILHTIGLGVRWYISGHAPWSDAYESMIYVAWATMFFGLTFERKSKLTIASAAFVTSMILMIAHWNWMDPQIANLTPVLNSYWLMIHVAVIVASYGPFTLAMILGIVALLLILLTNDRNKERMNLNLMEITYINEMAITVGLVMLTIGNFLGGQWANESWGRYWGWDPKETWALVSIMVYAFVIHARFVPLLRGKWIYNVMSIFAFYSILMTYFGVNFYLTGLHSYAKGDKVVTPSFVYISVAVLLLLSIVSYFKFKKYYKKN